MMHIIKNWIAISCWICTCLFAGFLTKAETVIPVGKADSLMHSGCFDAAATEYERVYFFSTQPNEKNSALYQKAMCLKQMDMFKKADECLHRMDLSFLNDSASYLVRHQMALCSYLSGDFSMAESQLMQLFYFIADSSLTFQSLPLYALTLNELSRWQEAKNKMLQFIRFTVWNAASKDSINMLIETSYQSGNFPKLKHPEKAILMSSILPGLGQVYAGYFWEGFVNASLQLVSLAFTGAAVYFQYYIASFMIGYSTFFRFYRGGQNRAEFLTNKSNYEKIRRYNDQLKKEILPFFR